VLSPLDIITVNIRSRHGTFWQWLKDQIVGLVPEEIAACEFECPKFQCRDGEWATCKRRILWAGDSSFIRPDPKRISLNSGGKSVGILTPL